MWLHHDLGWWGFVLAIVTLVLAYPLDVLAHLTTPMLRNWWAGRSVTALRERIAELEGQLAKMDRNRMMTDVEDEILSALPKLELFITMAVMLVIAAMGLLFTEQNPALAWRSILIMFGAIVVVMFSRTGLFSGTYRFIRKRSPKWQRMLEYDVAKLKAKLASHGGGDKAVQKNAFQ
jgi:hypothetical protein